MGNLLHIFKDNSGNVSSMRFLVIAIVLIQMITWAVMCFKQNQLISWDFQDVSVIMTALGAKAWQKGKNND